MADFLFANRKQEDLDELERIVAEDEAHARGKIRFSLEREVAFHGKLYQMSGNTTLQKFQDVLLPAFNYVYLKESESNPEEYHYSRDGFVTHGMLLEVLKDGTPEAFRTAMRRHLEPHFDHALNAASS
jgi:DNA-binding GntR family transcriptional regulator